MVQGNFPNNLKTSAVIVNWLEIEQRFVKIKTDTHSIAHTLRKIFIKNGKTSDFAISQFKNLDYICDKLLQFSVESLLDDKILGVVPGNINIMGFSPIRMELSRVQEVVTTFAQQTNDEIKELENNSLKKMFSKKAIEEKRDALLDSRQITTSIKNINDTIEDIYRTITQDINTLLIQYINGIRTVVKDLNCGEANTARIMVKLNLSIEMLQMNSRNACDFSFVNLLIIVGRIRKVEELLMSVVIPRDDFDVDFIMNVSANTVINRYLLNLKTQFDEKIELFNHDIQLMSEADTTMVIPGISRSSLLTQVVSFLQQKDIVGITTPRVREMSAAQAKQTSGYEKADFLVMTTEMEEKNATLYYFTADDSTLYFTVIIQ